MEIAVLVKQVPDTYGERRLDPGDWTLDRAAADPVIDEIDSRGVETALRLAQEHGGRVTVLTMGPESATESLRKALAMGADSAVHVVDERLAGSDAVATSAVLAAALRTLTFDLVIAGNESTDGRSAAVPAMIAERLALPAATSVQSVAVHDGVVTAERVTEDGTCQITAPLPALVSVTEKVGEPRYPSFKGIMAAKRKPVSTLSAADLGVDDSLLGLTGSGTRVVNGSPRPPKAPGVKIEDTGDGGVLAAEFLVGQRLI